MDGLIATESFSTRRGDGQRCPVDVDTDVESGEVKARHKSAPFYAYNKENYKAKVLLAREQPLANSILEFFVSEMDNTNALCISMNALEKLFNKSRQSLSKHIKVLEDRKFIEIFKIGNMNAYAINAYVVFTQGDSNLWRAKFKATMYLEYNEQSQKIKKEYAKQIK
ncbi:hypothetical protein [Photobacterium carnosum]|uniref:hypothetical protein n=1 Tax=Photobacterium carnosum TaxID=2023717 RepID=UPI001E475ADB|nr:hypothetical protein [Photobacterium carnosum]MCD9517126.1 hypothetical protein [Photobacterium carnosum]